MNAFTTLRTAGVTTRAAAASTGISRATMDRATRSSSLPLPSPLPLVSQTASTQNAAPKNKLADVEEQQILAVLHSPEFIDQTPAEVYATLLERGQYLCSITTMFPHASRGRRPHGSCAGTTRSVTVVGKPATLPGLVRS